MKIKIQLSVLFIILSLFISNTESKIDTDKINSVVSLLKSGHDNWNEIEPLIG